MRMLLSKKLPGIRLIPVELEIGRQPPAKGAQPVREIPSLGFARDAECALAGHVHVNLIAWLELQRFDNRRGKTDSEAVAPFGDLHDALPSDRHVEQRISVDVGGKRAKTASLD